MFDICRTNLIVRASRIRSSHVGSYASWHLRFLRTKGCSYANKKVLPAFYCRQGLLFALWRLALNIKGVAVFFHRDKALERLVLSFVQECLDGQASILIIQPFGTHSDNEVV